MWTHGAVEGETATRNGIGAPLGGDVHLRIWLGGTAFDYAAAAEAASNLIRDWRRRPWYAIELVLDVLESRLSLPRLPNERLFLGA
ncbi:hypothetical protein [Nocardia violaceofusca]|uniref:hypothetical protein n=1 Tax=Nocardia violaceofusca TaxID=941182 RepID=UPI0007A4ABD5|nr:hypothetical protein [Nocardia violaceofusca]